MRHLLIILTFLFFRNTFSQEPMDSVNHESTIYKLSFLTAAFSVEQHLKGNVTLVANIGSELSSNYTDDRKMILSSTSLFPFISVEPRIYLNLKERQSKGKRTDHFSGAYAGLMIETGYRFNNKLWQAAAAPLIGFQRSLGKYGYWNVSIGLGATFADQGMHFGILGNSQIGFILKSK